MADLAPVLGRLEIEPCFRPSRFHVAPPRQQRIHLALGSRHLVENHFGLGYRHLVIKVEDAQTTQTSYLQGNTER